MSGARHRQKGNRIEREIVDRHREFAPSSCAVPGRTLSARFRRGDTHANFGVAVRYITRCIVRRSAVARWYGETPSVGYAWIAIENK
jgi:hypothetical protein